MTARQLIIGALGKSDCSRAMLIAALINHGYTAASSPGYVDAWLPLMVERGDIKSRVLEDGTVLYGLGEMEIERDQGIPTYRTPSQVWKDAEKKRKKQWGIS